MRTMIAVVAAASLLVLSLPAAAWAQTRTGTGTASRGSSALGAGGFNAATSGMPSLGNAAQVSSGDRFVRDSRQAGAFVGADSADTREFVGQVGAGAAGQSRNAMQGRGRSTRRSTANANRGRNAGRSAEIRSAVTVGFRHQAPAEAELSAALLARLQRADRIKSLVPLEISIGNGTATLRGAVATSYDRALAEQLVRLEPGIRQVQNELTVTAAPEAPPTGDPFAPSLTPATPAAR